MLTKTLIDGDMPSERMFLVDETVLEDETDYLAVPLGYNLTLTAMPGSGASAAVYYTTKTADDLTGVASGDWESVAEAPTFGTQIQITGVKVIATGAVTVRGFLRKC